VFIMHEPTRKALEQHGLMRRVLVRRRTSSCSTARFRRLCTAALGCEFLITAEEGNQQEAYHLGIPCLILRSETEGP